MRSKRRLKLFNDSAAGIDDLLAAEPDRWWLKSIREQLAYLIQVENGEASDYSKLADINLGVFAAREIEGRNMPLANKLYAVCAEVERMQKEHRQ